VFDFLFVSNDLVADARFVTIRAPLVSDDVRLVPGGRENQVGDIPTQQLPSHQLCRR